MPLEILFRYLAVLDCAGKEKMCYADLSIHASARRICRENLSDYNLLKEPVWGLLVSYEIIRNSNLDRFFHNTSILFCTLCFYYIPSISQL